MGKKKDSLPHKNTMPLYPIPLPAAASRDELIAMTDDELVARIETLNGDMTYVTSCQLSTKPWEQEVAYVQRELGWRQDRRRRHDAWQAAQLAA